MRKSEGNQPLAGKAITDLDGIGHFLARSAKAALISHACVVQEQNWLSSMESRDGSLLLLKDTPIFAQISG